MKKKTEKQTEQKLIQLLVETQVFETVKRSHLWQSTRRSSTVNCRSVYLVTF